MIMIIGSQHDDILYFESVITNKREELVMGKFKVTIGTIFNQAVMLVDQVKTNYLSSALTLYLIEKLYKLQKICAICARVTDICGSNVVVEVPCIICLAFILMN